MSLSGFILAFCDANKEFKVAWQRGLRELTPEDNPFQPFRAEIQRIERELMKRRYSNLVIVTEDSASQGECIPDLLQGTPIYKYPSDVEGILYRISQVSRYEVPTSTCTETFV